VVNISSEMVNPPRVFAALKKKLLKRRESGITVYFFSLKSRSLGIATATATAIERRDIRTSLPRPHTSRTLCGNGT